jgi:hypothetical protein
MLCVFAAPGKVTVPKVQQWKQLTKVAVAQLCLRIPAAEGSVVDVQYVQRSTIIYVTDARGGYWGLRC